MSDWLHMVDVSRKKARTGKRFEDSGPVEESVTNDHPALITGVSAEMKMAMGFAVQVKAWHVMWPHLGDQSSWNEGDFVFNLRHCTGLEFDEGCSYKIHDVLRDTTRCNSCMDPYYTGMIMQCETRVV